MGRILGILIFTTLLFLKTHCFGQGNDFFWVGGSGNWSDTLHWSSSAPGLPTYADNVYFNATSFTSPNQTVTIDVAAACNHFDWAGATMNPILAGNKELTIHGSMILNSNMDVQFNGNVHFNSGNSQQFIQTAGISLKSHLYFEDNGMWAFQSDVDIGNKNIYFDYGSLNLQEYQLICGNFYSLSNNPRNLDLGSSEIIINAAGGKWQINGYMMLDKGTSVIRFANSDLNSEFTFDGGALAYHDVVLQNNTLIKNSNSFDNLTLVSEMKYKFEGGSTQTINENLNARGCSGLVEISSSNATQAIIAKTSGDIEVSFVALKSMRAIMASGGAFFAHNSVDYGNNTGINILTDSRDMYWVNGTGNWTDTTHWSSTPNGPDADCVPIVYDNVFFDNNSFSGSDTVNIDQQKTEVKDMIWTGEYPAILASSASGAMLRLYGSLQFNPFMTNNFPGPVYFSDSTGSQTIKTAHQIFYSNLIFDGKGGWFVYDSLKVNGNIYFYKGVLAFNTDYVISKTFHSDSAFLRGLDLGSATIEITGTSPYPSWNLNTENLFLNAGQSTINLTASNATFCNYAEISDTLQFHNVTFSSAYHSANLSTKNSVLCKFNRVIFASNGLIYGTNAYDTLSFTPGNRYEFEPGRTQTIYDEIWPSGECTGPILIRSQNFGETFNFHSNTDQVEVEYTTIQDINAGGSAVFLASNSVDLGNNTGWIVNQVTPGTLYWVGGNGNWNEPLNWSDFSGGPGGYCIPTPYDTVIFDHNSFSEADQVVKINLNNAFAHDLLWLDVGLTPDFSGTSSNYELLIFGSLLFNPDMEFTFPGEIFFESNDTGEYIQPNGIKFHNVQNNVYFNGKGGEWTLQDELDLSLEVCNKNVIFYKYGRLNTMGFAIGCYDFNSNYSTPRTFNPDTSFIHVCHDFIVNGTYFNLLENNSHVEIDSGRFYHRYGNFSPYHDLTLTSVLNEQFVETYLNDSIYFNDVVFADQGIMMGYNSHVTAKKVSFGGAGSINESNLSSANVYSIDSLLFNANGSVFGQDTIGFMQVDSTGLINGSGDYGHTIFKGDGNINGFNLFDTLSFSPGYSYTLEGNTVQTIKDQFDVRGNNCQPIYMQSSSSMMAGVHKETDTVWGELIEMSHILASGNAVFDAGNFSTDIDNSNQGWLFHNALQNYSLGNDTSILEGDTLYLCADRFNGGSTTIYEWKNCTTGEVLSNEMCITVTEKGYYCLQVVYDEGPGCIKYDTLFVGCFLGIDFDIDSVSCFGFSDGSIEIDIYSGVEPYDIHWYLDDQLIDSTMNIYGITAGTYYLEIEDGEQCESFIPVDVLQPDSLQLQFETRASCFDAYNGEAHISITGGTEPYSIDWSSTIPDNTLNVYYLSPGIYDVEVVDDHNCPAIIQPIEINEIPELTFSLIGTDLSCFNDGSGMIEITEIEGGTGNYTDFTWYKNSEYYSSGQTIDQLAAGEYSLIIQDDLNCQAERLVVLTEPDDLLLNLKGVDGVTELGSIDLTVNGGTEPYYYLWNTGAETQDIDPLGGGIYTVIVTDDHFCKATDSIFIDVHFRVLAPTAFSPNGDKFNNEFEIKGIGTDLKEFELSIFDRWGQEVFHTRNYNEFWNGRLNNTGKPQPIGVYTWQISLLYKGGQKTIDKGNVTLLR
ncbi:MAG: gliding motility-associated C-terminal domain-containing protein [Bacteroidales bacterium]|nr:gliding motility-associated C-terminal domain-containing protein [Bacteroidales bacterium]